MPLDMGLLALRLRKQKMNLKLWQRALINLYILGGYETPIKVTTLVDACYNWELTPYKRRSLYGTLHRSLEFLRLNSYVRRYNNPVRYKLVYSRRTASHLANIARKFDFPNAKTEDFL